MTKKSILLNLPMIKIFNKNISIKYLKMSIEVTKYTKKPTRVRAIIIQKPSHNEVIISVEWSCYDTPNLHQNLKK